MGRPPKPAEEHALKGDPSRRKLDKLNTEPAKSLIAEMPAKPGWLNKEAAAHWDELAPMLFEQGLLTRCDGALFAAYCQAVGTAILNERALNRGSKSIKYSNGKYGQRPEAKNAQEAWKRAADLGAHFGLTAKARKSLNITLKRPQGAPDAISERKAKVLGR